MLAEAEEGQEASPSRGGSFWGNPPRATVDFETRSAAPIKDTGSWRYAMDPTTQVLCMAWKVPGMPDVDLWHPAFRHLGMEARPDPEPLWEWFLSGGLVEAHNSFFERAVWRCIIVPQFGWPDIPDPVWRCSAAKAARFALPRALEDCARVLKLEEQKDVEGSKLMRRLTRPRKPRKAEVVAWEREQGGRPMPLLWHESAEEFERLFTYCQQDVRTEEAVSEYLPDLSPMETAIFLADQRVNERGVYCDLGAVNAAMSIVDKMTGGMTEELPLLTCPMTSRLVREGKPLRAALEAVAAEYPAGGEPPPGLIERATQRARVLAFVNERGVPMMDTQGTTVDAVLSRQDLPQDVHRVLEICRAVNRTSTSKYTAILTRACPDQRLRGTTLYHGSSTGRWTGSGFQPHNLPRGAIKDMQGAWDDILTEDPEWVYAMHGDVMEHLSHSVRGAIAAPPGRVLWVADYAAIESRVLFWIAGEESALQIFHRREDIYCEFAGVIYKRVVTKKDAVERQMGKQSILGLGFGMGGSKFMVTCAKYNIIITEEFAKEVVDIYRQRFPRVPQLWREQERAAISAVQSPGRTVRSGMIQWRVVRAGPDGKGMPFLHCKLPSGRTLAYCDPKILPKQTPWGETRPCLTFMGVDQFTRQWTRLDTYGGSIVENIVQATARDLLAEALLRAEATDTYEIVMHVHDELVAEADEGQGDRREFELLMAACPDWATGCPVEAEAPKEGALRRYKK